MTEALVPLLLALGDDELILGHRHSEWTGWAPHIEEDVAFSSIAQDEIGHAAAYYTLAGKALDKDPNEIAFGRSADGYRNALLCERPNGDWAYTLARHWLYDHADDLRLEALQESSDAELASLATKMRREERYHLIHADTWLKRIGNGPVEGRHKLVHALTDAYPDALGVFEPPEQEEAALAKGILPSSFKELEARFVERTASALDELGLPSGISPVAEASGTFEATSSGDLIEDDRPATPAATSRPAGGRSGEHSEDLRSLWDIMTKTYRENPGATW